MRVSCVIPAYNEAATVADVVQAARACPEVDEVVVVSDGSTDLTSSCAARAGADQVVVLSRNGGKGNAVLEAIRHARGECILLLDADLSGLRADHLQRLLAPVLAGQAEMTIALFADNRLHTLMRPLSGQRAIHRSLLQRAEALKDTGFGLEIALDRLARAHDARTVRVLWTGVGHRSKREKYGTVNGLRLQVRASSDLMRQARTAVAPRRSPQMVVALVLLVVLLTISLPVFFVHPTHAAASRLPPLPPPAPADRLLVVVAHPDDEVIAAGGLIAAARRAGAEVSVVVITNGDSNRLSAAVLTHRLRPRAAQLMTEGRIRQGETLTALARLGVPTAQVFFLGFPDRGLDRVMRSGSVPVVSPYTKLDRASYPDVVGPDAPYARRALVGLLRGLVARARPTIIITHGPFDAHADHRAVAALVDEVRGTTPTYAFLVHAAGFPRPLRMSARDPLMPPATTAIPAQMVWARFDLDPQTERLKQQALSAYRSQLLTPYLRLLLASFVRTNELFAVRQP